jgi:hypothetical protein
MTLALVRRLPSGPAHLPSSGDQHLDR